MVRRHPALRTALVGAGLALAVTGCGQDPAGLPTAADFTSAQRVWSDPWLAPDTAHVPEDGWGSPDGFVRREAGTRTTDYRGGGPEAVLVRELQAAQAQGWTLTGVSCGEEPSASLARGEGPDEGATAVVTATREGRRVVVVATGSVPHHLDGSWPPPPARLDVPGSCLFGGPEADLVDLSLGEPFDEVEDAGGDETEWQRDEATPEEESTLAAVNDDPWMQEIGLTVGAATLAADDARRRAPTGQVELTDRSLSEVVDDLGDWELTWASCARGRPVELTARYATDAGSAVARISAVGRQVSVTVTLPLPETPDNGWIDDVPVLGEDVRCLAGPAPGGRIVNQGTPVATVSESQPVAD